MSALTDRRCDICGASLEGRASTAKRCSGRCRAEASRRRRGLAADKRTGEARCEHCGGPIPETRRSDARYCSDGHREDAARARRALTGTAPAHVDVDRLAEIAQQLAALAVELHQAARSATAPKVIGSAR